MKSAAGVAWPWASTPGRVVEVGRGGAGDVVVEPGCALRGRIRVPGDKSVSHRALLLAALAPGRSVIRGLSDGDDVRRTALAMAAVGADVEIIGATGGERAGIGEIQVVGGRDRLHEALEPIDVGNSGTGIRLLLGWLASFPWLSVLHGDRFIAHRPMARVVEPLRLMGAQVDGRDRGRFPPLVVRGGDLRGIDYHLPVASAQVKSALLLAGLSAQGTTTVREPAPVRAHTEELLAAAGADVEVSADGSVVSVRASSVQPLDVDVPGDPSQAAWWVVAASVVPGSEVTVEGVYVGRARAGFLDVLRGMGADLEITMTGASTADIRVRHARLRGTVVDGPGVPGLIDEIPALAVAAACAEGVTEFRDAQELRVKESDRIATMSAVLSALGAAAEPRPDGLMVGGGGHLHGGDLDSQGDHRIAMAAAVAALAADAPSRVRGWEAVATSYPSFLGDLAALQAPSGPEREAQAPSGPEREAQAPSGQEREASARRHGPGGRA